MDSKSFHQRLRSGTAVGARMVWLELVLIQIQHELADNELRGAQEVDECVLGEVFEAVEFREERGELVQRAAELPRADRRL